MDLVSNSLSRIVCLPSQRDIECLTFLDFTVHTMAEVKLTGNCMKGSRPLLQFDAAFDASPHMALLKEMFIQVFGSPKGHPKTKPFIDHVFSFFIADNRIWFRNYQIVYPQQAAAAVSASSPSSSEPLAAADPVLVEIGPRFVLAPIRIFESSFGGAVLWDSPSFVSPNALRSELKRKQADKLAQRHQSTREASKHKAAANLPKSGLDNDQVF